MTETPNLAASGAKEIAEQLATISGGRVLDVGTGKGKFIETLMQTLKSFDSFVGIDIDHEDLAKAREAFENQPVRFQEMNAEHLDFPDASFDTVCIANSLHHLSDFPQVLAEMMRVLKPSGHFVVEEMYQDGQKSDAQHTDMLEHHWIAKIERIRGITHHETLRRNQIVTGLESLNFSKLEVLDSSRYVKCLFCSQRFVCEDPKSDSTIEFFIKGIDKTLQGLKPSERLHELFAEAERIKERVKETGVADASLIFTIGTK